MIITHLPCLGLNLPISTELITLSILFTFPSFFVLNSFRIIWLIYLSYKYFKKQKQINNKYYIKEEYDFIIIDNYHLQ